MAHRRRGRVIRKEVLAKKGNSTIKLVIYKKAPGRGVTNPRSRKK